MVAKFLTNLGPGCLNEFWSALHMLTQKPDQAYHE